MNKLSSNQNLKLYLFILGAGCLFLLWIGLQAVRVKLGQLPVIEMPRADKKVSVTDVKSLYPVWRKHEDSKLGFLEKEKSQLTEIDAVFQKVAEIPLPSSIPAASETIVPSQKFDIQSMAKNSILIDAIADNGSIINGVFYRFGSTLDIVLTKPNGERIQPTLISAKSNSVRISVDGKEMSFVLAGEN